MDCSTCINRFNPFKTGYCRTMTRRQEDNFCYMTKEDAIEIEQIIYDKAVGWSMQDAREQIKWLKGLEG